MGLGVRTNPKSRPKKPEIAKTSMLGVSLLLVIALLSCTIVLLEIKSLSDSLTIAEPCKEFFQQVVIR